MRIIVKYHEEKWKKMRISINFKNQKCLLSSVCLGIYNSLGHFYSYQNSFIFKLPHNVKRLYHLTRDFIQNLNRHWNKLQSNELLCSCHTLLALPSWGETNGWWRNNSFGPMFWGRGWMGHLHWSLVPLPSWVRPLNGHIRLKKY
jgi:hypothetical protein